MTQITGKEESIVQSRMHDFEKKLKEFLPKLHPPDIDVDQSIERLLKLSLDELNKMSVDDCYIGSYKLKQYSVYLQQKENRVKSISVWIKNSLDAIIGQNSANYGNNYTKYEEKRLYVIADNSYAKILNTLYTEYIGYENELNMLANRISELGKTLQDIGYNKRQK